MFGTRVNLLSDWDKRFQLMPCASLDIIFFSEYHLFPFRCSFGDFIEELALLMYLKMSNLKIEYQI